jgi:O-acetyl-ADP-ribose deacetylase (regulator of RNase III)
MFRIVNPSARTVLDIFVATEGMVRNCRGPVKRQLAMTRRLVGSATIVLVQGDITRQDTDAIVNAANTALLGGGGVDGAIHRRGGPAILEECRALGGCATGDAKVTGGGRLAARWVVHAVGPVYRDGRGGEATLLASAYRRSLEEACRVGARSIAFPSISTGAYRYPVAGAAAVALSTVHDFLAGTPGGLEEVRFVLFTEVDFGVYADALARI